MEQKLAFGYKIYKDKIKKILVELEIHKLLENLLMLQDLDHNLII